jgi:hypothetical protein
MLDILLHHWALYVFVTWDLLVLGVKLSSSRTPTAHPHPQARRFLPPVAVSGRPAA